MIKIPQTINIKHKPKKNFKLFIIVAIVYFLMIIISSIYRSLLDKSNFISTFDNINSTALNKLWDFISSPTIFITLVICVFIIIYIDYIFDLLPEIEGLSVGGVSIRRASYLKNDSQTINNNQTTKEKAQPEISFESTIISLLSVNFLEFLIEADDKLFSIDDIVYNLDKYCHDEIPINLESFNENTRFYLFYGYYNGINNIFQALVNLKIDEKKENAYITIKPKVKEIIKDKIAEEIKKRQSRLPK